jgi:pimeloyl-ACP methyl ester carboxylesterase
MFDPCPERKTMILGQRRRMTAIARPLRRISYLALALTALGALPPVKARAKAVAVIAESFGLFWPRPFAAVATRRQVQLGGVTGDIYGEGEPWPAIVLVPGAAPDGKDDARVVRLARALARAARTVFVPQLALAEKRLVMEDIDDIVAAVLALYDLHPVPVTLLGFSYGGSFSLLAAADDRLDGSLGRVATFGAYFDLVGVAQAVNSGRSLVNGDEIPWDAHPRAREVFREVAVEMAPEGIKDELRGALAGRLEASAIGPEARAVHDFVVNEDPQQTYALAARLPEQMRATLESFSPASVVDGIGAEVIALHSTDDPVVPYGEALRLRAALPDAALETVSLFSHVNLAGGSPLGKAADLLATWRFTTRLLAAPSGPSKTAL